MASHNPQEHLFNKHITSVTDLIKDYVSSVVYGGDYITAETEIINYLTDMYSESCVGGNYDIIDFVGFKFNTQKHNL